MDTTSRLPTIRANERIASRCICCNSNELNRSPAILMPFVAKRAFGWEPVEITADWGLRDIRPGMAYPLCNSVQCSICGALFLDIRFTDAEMASLYSGYRDKEYTELRERFEPGYKSRNGIILGGSTHIPKVEAFLSPHVAPPMKILDWGGDTGLNTPFKSRNAAVHIYDISRKPTIEGTLGIDKDAIRGTDYDLIVLSHVLEHLPYPAETVSQISSVMGRKTVLYIEVPYEDLLRLNPETKGVHKKKRHWHEHINFFTRESLHAVLQCCGLKVVDMHSFATTGDTKDWHVFAVACRLLHA